MNNKHWWSGKSFVYVGRMSKDKGVDIILNAWLYLYQKHSLIPQLWLVGGNASEIEDIRKYVNNQQLLDEAEKRGQIVWWGYQNASGISAILTKALVLLMHSKYEPGGRVVIEAMASAIPVIGTPYGFAKDLIKDWENGFLVEYLDFKKLCRRMEHFIFQPLLNLALGYNAKDVVMCRLDEWDFLNTHCDVYLSAKDNKEYNKEIKERPKIKNYFSKREVGSSYLYNSVYPQTNDILSLLNSMSITDVLSIKEFDTSNGSSKLWKIETSEKNYIAKWSYTKLAKKPLWNILQKNLLVEDSKYRYDVQIQASKLDGFIPLIAKDDTLELLLYEMYDTISFKGDYHIFYDSRRLLEKLCNSIKLENDFISKFDNQDFLNMNITLITEQKERLKNYFLSLEYTLDLHTIYSLRIAWIETEYLLKNCEYLQKYFLADNLEAIEVFKEFSKLEINYPASITHGSADLEHIVKKENTLYFIDGEHIHFSKFGDDMACIVFYANENSKSIDEEVVYLKNAIKALKLNFEKNRLVISWLAMHSIRSMIQYTYVIKETRRLFYKRRVEALKILSKDDEVIM